MALFKCNVFIFTPSLSLSVMVEEFIKVIVDPEGVSLFSKILIFSFRF